MTDFVDFAAGSPGIPSRWTSSAKSGVGTALSAKSPVWFTLSHGILNEVYYPRVDSACTRDLGLLITGPDGYFSEVKRDCTSVSSHVEAGIPAFHSISTAKDGLYRLENQIISDPARPSVLQRVTYTPLVGTMADYKVYALLAPHLVNAGVNNSGWVGEHAGTTMLFASGRSRYLALGSSLGWSRLSVGYVGSFDGYQQLVQDGKISTQYQRPYDGNVALTGLFEFSETSSTAVLALSFGQSETEAGAHALDSLRDSFDVATETYCSNWRGWQRSLHPLDRISTSGGNSYRVSTAVLASHRAEDRQGAVVASLSIPWGAAKGDDDPRIRDTVTAIDQTLKVQLPQVSLWYRYTGDGSGEHVDGGPFDDVGKGRAWPLLAGERAHYELAAGNSERAATLLATLEASAGAEGLLPEQSWDAPDIPERNLYLGQPAGSAMPLVWAHAEHIKLLRSLADGAVFDTPPRPLPAMSPARRHRLCVSGASITGSLPYPRAKRYDWSCGWRPWSIGRPATGRMRPISTRVKAVLAHTLPTSTRRLWTRAGRWYSHSLGWTASGGNPPISRSRS